MAVGKGPKRNVSQKRRHVLGMSSRDQSTSKTLKHILLQTFCILRTGRFNPQRKQELLALRQKCARLYLMLNYISDEQFESSSSPNPSLKRDIDSFTDAE
jgi:hypothetical protein